MKQQEPAVIRELKNELQLIQAQNLQVKRMLLEQGNKTTRAHKAILDLSERPRKGVLR